MVIATSFIAKLDYPSASVMGLSTLALIAFIGVGGWLFKRADERAKAERQARSAKEAKPTNP